MLDHKNIKILKTINFYKNISRAAAELYTAQSNLSRALKNIEKNLGFKVFDRSKTPLKLTEEGQILFEFIEKFESVEKLMYKNINKNKILSPKIKIGSLSFMSQYIIPNIIPDFIKLNPNLDISLKKYDSMTFVNALLNKEIDLFITNRSIKNSELKTKFVINDPIYLMYPKNYLNINEYNFSDFINSTFYLLHPGKNMRNSADDIFNDYNFFPKNIKLISNIMNGVSLVRAGKGVTFVYGTSIDMLNSFEYCDFLKINGNYAEINIVYKDDSLKEIVNELANIIKNNIKSKYI